MPTSELSDALNPYASQARRVPIYNEYSQIPTYSYEPVAQTLPQPQFQQNQWHVSELQNAMVQPEPEPEPLPLPPVVRPQQQASRMLTELVRIVAATQNAQEAELKRRREWEEEQEVKAARKQAEMEQKMLDLHSEILTLRSKLETVGTPVEAPTPNLPTPQFTPAVSFMPQMGITSPISPVSQTQPSPYQQPMFVQGSSIDGQVYSSTRYTRVDSTYAGPQPSTAQPMPQIPQQAFTEPGFQSITPDPSPHLSFIEASISSPLPSSKPSKRHRRRRSQSRSSDDSSSSASSGSSAPSRPRKRISHHDTRCYTINHAMRLHMLRMMSVETDKELPDSHTEGTSLSPSEPVRFVWDKTTKQSVHNSRMKTRVLEDIQQQKRLYKYVDRKEFGKKSLDTAFEQCFTTMRQKFKSQRDERIAEHQKRREDGKARKSRHISRRKTKLNNRSEARNRLPAFEHVMFDGALQVDCMSSEESDYESDPNSPQPNSILRTHGYAWRSARLLRFYCILDDEETAESSTKPKRGSGKKERRIGPVKDEFILPPQGVATWMVSQRWYKASLNDHPDLPYTLGQLIENPAGFVWTQFPDLGDESTDEEQSSVSHHQQQQPGPVMAQLQWQPVQQFHQNGMHNVDLTDTQHRYDVHTYTPNYTF
ncbi:hypothetical protein HYPSUDRAFT_174932 [Hypholoma sublateritium FD-334 SS-4]|uniref:Uncharacterized protein n=1 Tax=Hypholoma sublateritium (strain FD-334 SS-4) TaxID=945553 RepID=A0A0D2PNZ5_HYPSF|nr:hypothetical protein HYPSUDRAFT_174932 [Hypholoma sublateritium FD-334 SS-4]